jgi:LPPG:FO 2-phospho-L-lactate transferase
VVTAEARSAIESAELLVLAPSNPFLSIGAILAVPGITEAMLAAPATVVAVSPIVGGAALRGPADRLLQTLGGEASALGVARHYQERHAGLVDALVIDTLDAAATEPIRAAGLAVQVTDSVMRDHADRRRLADAILDRWSPRVSGR